MGEYVAHAKDMAGEDATPSDVPDVLAPDLRVVFVGINPGRVSAAARAHFANPRNDFWRLLHAARLTSRLYEPAEQFALLEEGIGVTNAAYRTTPGSGDLRRADFAGSAERLERIARELRPRWLAFVGKEAYRGTFGSATRARPAGETLGETRLFVLPSTSPANAAVPWDERRRWFCELAGRASGLPRARERPGCGRRRSAAASCCCATATSTATGGSRPAAAARQEKATSKRCAESSTRKSVSSSSSSARCSWELRGWTLDEPGFGSFLSRVYLVRVDRFEPPHLTEAQELGWFSTRGARPVSTRPLDLAERLSSASDS